MTETKGIVPACLLDQEIAQRWAALVDSPDAAGREALNDAMQQKCGMCWSDPSNPHACASGLAALFVDAVMALRAIQRLRETAESKEAS